MKTFKEFINENQNELIVMPPAKSDQEIFDRLDKLEKAGIRAYSGSRDSATDILVNFRHLNKAKKVLGIK